MAPKKRLSWEEWQKKANASYIKGEYGVQQMVADWGYPEGMSEDTYKIEFDKGKAKRKDRAGRRAQRAKATIKREESAAVQTVGEDVYNKGVVAVKGSGLEEHHKRTISVYAPFFEGLNTQESKELAEWFIDEGAPLGNAKQNLTAINKIEHEAIHNWMKENFIQPTGKPLLNFKGVPLNERLPAALMFLENVQPAVDQQLSLIKEAGTVKFAPNRAQMTALAGAGIAALGPLGTAASAAETAGRTQIAQETGNPLDYVQAGIAGVSTAADVASYAPPLAPVASAVSTATDVTNVAIDTARSIDIGNELKYIGGQVRLGKLPYGLEQAASWIKSAF